MIFSRARLRVLIRDRKITAVAPMKTRDRIERGKAEDTVDRNEGKKNSGPD